jgi:hypothetical protein
MIDAENHSFIFDVDKHRLDVLSLYNINQVLSQVAPPPRNIALAIER